MCRLNEPQERVSDKETKELLLQSEMRATAKSALDAEQRCVKMEGMLMELHGETEKQRVEREAAERESEEKSLALMEMQEQMRSAKSQARK